MTTTLTLRNRRQVVIPVRLDRAVVGAPILDAPDLDDRGHSMPRPAGFNATDARGVMFGIGEGDTVRVKIVREDIAASAPLFATVSAAADPQVEIIDPPNGVAIGATGEIRIRAIASTASGQKLEIRFGSATGPVLCEAEPHVFPLLTLNVTPHLCTIHQVAALPGGGTVPTLGPATWMTDVFDIAAAVWRAAGVRLNVGAIQNEVYFGFTRDDFARTDPAAGPGSEARLVRQNQVPNTCNVYFIRFMDSSLGVGVNRDSMVAEGWSVPAVIIGVEGDITGGVVNRRGSAGAALIQEVGNDVAHEIGHFLTLQHVRNQNAGNAARDSYGRRQLMHPINLLPRAVAPLVNSAANAGPRFDDCGYGLGGGGRGHRGCLLTLKNFSTHSTDGEVARARARFRSPRLF